jgi:5'-methylthioadenosine phosphorylase
VTDAPRARIGVFGGSGFYQLFDDGVAGIERVSLDTPFGPPSAPVTLGTIHDVPVAFLPRHGVNHEFLPAQVPTRANLWAFRMLGVERVLGPCAAGSLRKEIEPGHFVVLDQLVDRTWGRADTFYDQGDAHHVTFADPYCADLGAHVLAAAGACSITAHRGGTVVVIPGPRFSTRAESRWFRSHGWDVVNMTQYPEAYLARELGMCYSGIALITDYDTGVEDDPDVEPVSMDAVFAFFSANVHRVRDLIGNAVPRIPSERTCTCADALGPLAH